MKLEDIPVHVTDLKIPWFTHACSKKFKTNTEEWEVTPLFHLNYWGGPLSGMIKYCNQMFYAVSIYHEDRCFWAAFELTEEEKKNIMIRHQSFVDNVGDHTVYFKDANGEWTRKLASNKPQGQWKNFYDDKTLPVVDYKEIISRDIFGILENPFR